MPISKELIAVSKLPWFPNIMKELGYEPVRHGRWIPSDKGDCTYTCSNCGFFRDAYLLDENKYCPHCGSRMDEV